MRDPADIHPDRPTVLRLKTRADFVRVSRGKRWHGNALTLQANASARPDTRVGFTLTKKVGNAVVRNRARRRLREALRLSGDLPVRLGHDYVIVGRIEAIRLPFDTLTSELSRAVRAVHDEAGSRRSGAGRAGRREEPRRKP